MQRIVIGFLVCLLPALSLAQSSTGSTLIVENSKPVAATNAPSAGTAADGTPLPASLAPNFPAWAVTKVGERTTGQSVAPPAAPSNPATPAAAPGAPLAATANAPASPASPASPGNKLWPRDTVPIFMQSCTGFHAELVPACQCVITNLILKMPHDEFLALSEKGLIEQDARLIAIRQQCVATPKRKE